MPYGMYDWNIQPATIRFVVAVVPDRPPLSHRSLSLSLALSNRTGHKKGTILPALVNHLFTLFLWTTVLWQEGIVVCL
jgi:hypothetical protein